MNKAFQKALFLEYATLAWNVIGCVIIFIASIHSSSVSLFGFGIDSLIEIFASLIVIWQLKAIHPNKQAVALKLIGIAFLLLSLYIIIQSLLALMHHTHANPSAAGILWLIITAIFMFLLAYGKKKIGTVLNNAVVIKEAGITIIDGLLALAVLSGLLLTKYFEWWWADVLSGGILTAYALKEAIQSFTSK